MRTLPDPLKQKLDSGVASLCRCWRLVRADGTALGFTDHDVDLQIGSALFEATDGFESTAIERDAGLNAQGGEIHGVLRSERIREQDIEAGLYDGARIEAFLVDWEAPQLDLLLDVAWLGEIRRRDGQFIAETRDAYARWDQPQGRLYTATCTATFADAACSLAEPEFTEIFTLTGTTGERTYSGATALSRPDGYFTLGLARFTHGPNAGFSSRVEWQDAAGLRLQQAPPVPPIPGDEFQLVAGCDKRFSTCRDRFANTLNFRGFPHVPAPESIFTYAVPGEGHHKGRPLIR